MKIWARKRPFFFLGAIVENIWLTILKEALDSLAARTDAPVSGAKLRIVVKKLAEDRSLPFPPEGMTKWSSFLDSFPNDITVIRNPGSDILVVPTSRPDLQATAVAIAASTNASSSATRLRSDIFEALTRIPVTGEKALYLPKSDAIIWLKDNDGQIPPDAVAVPITSLADEFELRRQFVSSAELTGPAEAALNEAVGANATLRKFSEAIRSYGLIQQWHSYRLANLTQRLRDWASHHHLQFPDSWLGLDQNKPGHGNEGSAAISANKRGLVELAGLLSEEDISRISVPLDVVLRLLSTR